MNYEIGNPQMVWLLLFAPAALILMIYSTLSNRKALAKLGAKPTSGGTIRRVVSGLSLLAGIVLLTIACMDIRWGKTTREVPQKGLEVVFALDVSRSMLAEDARPNRLVRAKQQITDMVGEMAGDRVGLVIFAGEAKQAVPLTNHYNDFRQKLETVGPHSIPTGGSQLSIAIQGARDAFISKTSDHKTVVLFTDGEDQESQPIELAKKLHTENGLRIFTVGLGDVDKGARIPQDQKNTGQFLEHQGQQVWSKLNGSILREIATETQAAYIPAGTKRVNMADVYHNYIANIEKSEFETAKINAFIPRFQWFALPALVCLFVHGWLTTGRKRNKAARSPQIEKRSQTSVTSTTSASKKAKVAAAAMMLFLPPGIASGQSTVEPESRTVAAQINLANELVRQDKNSEAISAFNEIEATVPDERDSLNYNLAVAHYGNSDFEAARSLFAETSKSSNDRIATDSRYNIGNCLFAKSLPLAQQQPDAAIEQLELAIKHYRSALRLDRNRADARENLERAKKLIKQIQQNQQQQSPQQNEQQNQDQSKDEQQQNQQQQSDESEQSGEDQEQQNPEQQESSDSNDSEPQSGDEKSSDENQSQNEQSESQQKSDGESQPQQQSSDQQSEDSKQPQNSSADEQRNNTAQQQDQQESGQPKANSGDQQSDQKQESQPTGEQSEKEGKDPPQGEISAANEQQPGDANEKSMLNPTGQNEDKNGMMSRQEALKLLQAVRDRDMLRRLRQQQLQRSGRVRVEKDW